MTYVENILAIYHMATPDECANGIAWYQNARHDAEDIAARHGVSLRVAVGVIAALSPNNKWVRNVTDADNLIAAYIAGEHVESVAVCTYNKMRQKAWGILQEMPDDDQHVMRLLNGQKIVSFFCNIMGHDTCTIDGHALNIARGERVNLSDNKTNIGKKLYAELQGAYNVAAHSCGLKAYEMQAITWVAWRRLHNIK